MTRLYRDFPGMSRWRSTTHWLCRHRAAHRHHLRAAAAGRGHPEPLFARTPIIRDWPTTSSTPTTARARLPRAGRGPALRADRPRGAARAAHAVAYLRAPGPVGRDGRLQLAIVPGGPFAKAGLPGHAEQFHALDYAVYAYLQRGRDSAARAVVAKARPEAEPRPRSSITTGRPWRPGCRSSGGTGPGRKLTASPSRSLPVAPALPPSPAPS